MSADFYTEKVVKAKKQHVCEGCHLPIPESAFYMKCAGVFCGDFFSSKLCAECIEHLDECDSCKDAQCDIDGWMPGDIGEWRLECKPDAITGFINDDDKHTKNEHTRNGVGSF